MKKQETLIKALCLALFVIILPQHIQAQEGGVLLWNKLGSNEEISNSEAGVNGIINPPIGFQAVQHNNGVALKSGTAQIKFNQIFGTSFPDEGTIEFWWIPAHDENSSTGSHYAERQSVWLSSDEVMNYWWDTSFAIGLTYRSHGVLSDMTWLSFYLYDNQTDIIYGSGTYALYELEFLAGQLMHVAITWDKSLVTSPVKLYIDGVERTPVSQDCENCDQLIEKIQGKMQNPAWTYDLELHRRSKRKDGADNQFDAEQYVDNLIVRNYAKTDFSDRFIESPFGEGPWHVDDDNIGGPWDGSEEYPFQYIQDGIDAAMDGHTVVVMPGNYEENINFLGKAITVESNKGAALTTIKGTGGGSVVRFVQGEGSDSVLEGFTITNGESPYGGGILCNGCSAVIRKNIIVDNRAMDGGGIFCEDGASPSIEGNIIKDNKAVFGDGGGIYSRSSSPKIIDNVISGNQASGFLKTGGGIWSGWSSVNMVNNVITGNSATTFGGGIFLNYSSAILTNNTISLNSASKKGGGIFFYKSSPPVTNTILWDNEAGDGAEIFLSAGSNPQITYSDVKGGWPGDGNMDEEPLFVDPENGDYHLQYGSLCTDAGDNDAPELPDTDWEGDPRMTNDIVDMGADEFSTHLYYSGDVVPGETIDLKIIGAADLQVRLFLGTGIKETPEPSPWGDLYLERPLKIRYLGIMPSKGVLIYPQTVPLSWEPDEQYPFQALVGSPLYLDSELTNLMVLP